jgi:hypothetical protein
MEQIRLIFLRNGAFLFRVDENLENPETFRTEMLVSSWAEHTRQNERMTKMEREIFERALGMHVGDEGPTVRHYVKADRMSTPLGCCQVWKGTGLTRPIPCGPSCACFKIPGCRQPKDGVLDDEDLSNNRSEVC